MTTVDTMRGQNGPVNSKAAWVEDYVVRDGFDLIWSQQYLGKQMEGIEGDLCFPAGTAVAGTRWKCILDPIDGTRGIMYDKRSAWALGGIAPQRGEETMLSGIVAADVLAMRSPDRESASLS